MVMQGFHRQTQKNQSVDRASWHREAVISASHNYTGQRFACKFGLLSSTVLYRLEVSTEQTQNSKLILNVVFKKINVKLISQQANINPGQMLTL